MREGTTAPPPGTSTDEQWTGAAVRHIAVVVQRCDHVEAALAVAVRLAEGASLRLALIGIPIQRPIVHHLAPMSGAVSFDQLTDEALEDAECAARLAALSAPGFAETRYRRVDSWRAPCLLRALREGQFCALVLGGRPERRADRRKLEAAAREGAARVVMVAADGRRDGAAVSWVAPVSVGTPGLQARPAR